MLLTLKEGHKKGREERKEKGREGSPHVIVFCELHLPYLTCAWAWPARPEEEREEKKKKKGKKGSDSPRLGQTNAVARARGLWSFVNSQHKKMGEKKKKKKKKEGKTSLLVLSDVVAPPVSEKRKVRREKKKRRKGGGAWMNLSNSLSLPHSTSFFVLSFAVRGKVQGERTVLFSSWCGCFKPGGGEWG